jgi:MFS family permease
MSSCPSTCETKGVWFGRTSRVREHAVLRPRRRPGAGYRWAVLAAGTVAQASFSAITVGLAVLAPQLRAEFGLSLGDVGLLLSAAWLGAFLTLLPWGLAADRFGERLVLSLGLLASAACVTGAAFASVFGVLLALLALSGATGASVNSASGRAVMLWFAPNERGLALGIRQTAIPAGGLIAALVLPALSAPGGSEAAFLFLAGLLGAGAVGGWFVLRDRGGDEVPETFSVAHTLRDRRLWRLSLASGLYMYAQVAIIGFGVLFLHDSRGLGDHTAALVIAVAQLLAVGLRIGSGRWSDLVGSRIGPLRHVGLAITGSLVLAAGLSGGPLWLLVPAVALAGGLSMAWNALSFTAAAELAGAARSGAAIGFQQTVLSGVLVLAPMVFAAIVSAGSWTLAFGIAALLPLAGWWGLRPLVSSRTRMEQPRL